jgi:hypothetical protein
MDTFSFDSFQITDTGSLHKDTAAAQRREIISATDHNPGPDSPHGCGSHSNYYVTRSTRSA